MENKNSKRLQQIWAIVNSKTSAFPNTISQIKQA